MEICLFSFQKYSAYKYHWSGIGLPTQLEITPCSLDQLDPTSNKVIASYDYKDIVATIGNGMYTWCSVKYYFAFHLRPNLMQNVIAFDAQVSRIMNKVSWLPMANSLGYICFELQIIMKLYKIWYKPPINTWISQSKSWVVK